MFVNMFTKLFKRSKKIEVGKSYRIRSGEVIRIVDEDNTDFRSLEGFNLRDQHGRFYNREGRMHHQRRFTNPNEPSRFDIMEMVG